MRGLELVESAVSTPDMMTAVLLGLEPHGGSCDYKV